MFTKEQVVVEVLLLLNSIVMLNGINLALEAERQIKLKHSVTVRSDASEQKAVHLFQGDWIYVDYCLTKTAVVQLKSVTYSNDGPSDTLEIFMDKERIGKFKTKAVFDGGKGWNLFHSVDITNASKFQSQGRHRIGIRVEKTDTFGVEIDKVHVHLPHGSSDSFSSHCNIFCFDDIHYVDEGSHKADTHVKARAVQNSVKTRCAEEDNINIPLFHESARQFVITATTPKYVTFLNDRDPDWRNCQMAGPFWKFTEFHLFDTIDMYNDNTRMKSESRGKTWELNIDFSLEGPRSGSTDSEIGTEIHLNLGLIPPSLTESMSVSLSYLDRYSQWSTPLTKYINSENRKVYWTTPDFTLKEGSGNKLRLQFQSSEQRIVVKELFMRKRYIIADKSTELYNDGMVIIEGVDYDMWWRINETMTVMIDKDNLYDNVDYLRIYQRSPWTSDGFSQVFVIYQDGNIRLLPMTPHGLDWVPFGSSVLLGQTDLHSTRPSAPILHISINTSLLYMTIFYRDGGIISLQLKTAPSKTQLVLSDAKYVKDTSTHPFLTFRSMWIADGNADVDHVTVDGTVTKGIISNWTELSGTFIAFYRKCISKHNTLSPDISVKIIK